MSKYANPNQIRGEIRSHIITSCAFPQCGIIPAPAGMNMRAILTPRIDPMRAWELDTGSARYQAPRSQIIAETRIEITRIIPKLAGWLIMVERGRRWRMLIATAIPPKSTQRKLSIAAIITDFFGAREWLYITGAIALAVSFIPLTNSNARTIRRQIPRTIKVKSIKYDYICISTILSQFDKKSKEMSILGEDSLCMFFLLFLIYFLYYFLCMWIYYSYHIIHNLLELCAEYLVILVNQVKQLVRYLLDSSDSNIVDMIVLVSAWRIQASISKWSRLLEKWTISKQKRIVLIFQHIMPVSDILVGQLMGEWPRQIVILIFLKMGDLLLSTMESLRIILSSKRNS